MNTIYKALLLVAFYRHAEPQRAVCNQARW